MKIILKIKKSAILFVAFFVLFINDSNGQKDNNTIKSTQATSVSFNSNLLRYDGRVDLSGSEYVTFFWPGNTIIAKFKGTEIKILMETTWKQSYFNVIMLEQQAVPAIEF
jgi:hypothetical protein